MSFALYPDRRPRALAVPPGPPVFTPFAALSAPAGESHPPYEQMMFIRVAMLGGGTSVPTLSVAAGTGIPVALSRNPQPVFSLPGQAGYVGDVSMEALGANVFDVMVGFVAVPPVLPWRLGIRHDDTAERHFTWAVADNAAQTAHPWVAPSPVGFRVIATIQVQGDPRGIAVDDARQTAYVANYDSSSVSVIDLGSHAVVDTVPVGQEPRNVVIDSATHIVYIANTADKAIFAIDPISHAVTTPVGFTNTTSAMAIDSARRRLYVAAPSNVISIIDLDIQRVIRTVPLPIQARSIAIDPVLHTVYANGSPGHGLCSFNPDSAVVTTIDMNAETSSVAVDSANHVVYASCTRDNAVLGFELGDGAMTTIRTGHLPKGIAVDSEAYTLYVANFGGASLSAIDTRIGAQTAVIPVGDEANHVCVSSMGQTLVNTNSGDGTVSIVERLASQ